MRLALIRPLYRTPDYDPEIQEALGLEMLAAYVRSYGHQVLLLDVMLTGQCEEAVARRAAAFRPDDVGFSAMSRGDLESIRFIVSRLVDLLPGALPHMAVGGSVISTEAYAVCGLLPREIVCVSYEGERAFERLLDAWGSGGRLAAVPSLVYQLGDGAVRHTAPAAAIEALDELPLPARDLIEYVIAGKQAVSIQGSRGCTGTCAYCCAPAFPHPASRRWRGRSPQLIADEMAAIAAKWPVQAFNFVDDDFLGPPDESDTRADAFASAIIRHGLHVGFGIQARPSTLTRSAITCLARAGLAYVFFGLETDDDVVLRKWGRLQDLDSAWAAVDQLRAVGIEVQLGCIPFHPDSTLASVRRLAVSLRDRKLLNCRTASNRLQLLPKSRLYEDATRADDTEVGSGPFTPRVNVPRVEMLHRYLIDAVGPLRPAWVHGASVLPNLAASVRAAGDGYLAGRRCLVALRAVLSTLDAAVGNTLFGLLDEIDSGGEASSLTREFRSRNLRVAEAASKELAGWGLVESYETLREAIRKDTGL